MLDPNAAIIRAPGYEEDARPVVDAGARPDRPSDAVSSGGRRAGVMRT